jgi:hypothetical protein
MQNQWLLFKKVTSKWARAIKMLSKVTLFLTTINITFQKLLFKKVTSKRAHASKNNYYIYVVIYLAGVSLF